MSDPLDAMIFGTMRLNELASADATDLLCHLLEAGVERFHSSVEYPSFPMFAEVLAAACRRTGTEPTALRHVVKVAAPHFGEESFSADDLRERIRAHAHPLGADGVDVVQWMVRHDLADEPGRLRILREAAERVGETVAALRQDGLARRFGCFPYTDSFREAVLAQPWCDVLVDYLNPLEEGCRAVFPRLRADQSVIGIRPLLPLQPTAGDATGGGAAGRGSSEVPEEEADGVGELLAYALSDPLVEAVIVGTGKLGHADEIIAGIRRCSGARARRGSGG